MAGAGSRADLRIAAGVLAGIAAGALLSVVALQREWRIAQAEHHLSAQVQQLMRQRPLLPNTRPIDPDQALRLLLLEAQARMLEAPYAADSERRAMLASALAALRTVASVRSESGEAEVALAHLHALFGPAVAAREALVRSYAETPYLRGAAGWRVGEAFAQWDYLPAATRERAVNEAVWYARLRAEYRDPIFRAALASPAYVAFLLRWRDVRAGDDDLIRFRADR